MVFMTLSSSVFSILLLSGDSEIQSQFKQTFKDAAIKTSGDLQSCGSDNNDCWKALKNQLTDEHKGAGATLPKP